MPKEKGISHHQLINLIITFLIGTFIIVGSRTIAPASNSGWAIVFANIFPSLLLAFILITLQKRFPGKTLVEYNEIILGKFLGKVLNISYLLYFIFLLSLIGDNLVFIYTDLFYSATPPSVFYVTLYFLCLMAALGGITNVARLGEIGTPFLLAIVLITSLMVFLSPETDLGNLFPLFTEGTKPILQSFWYNFTFPFGEIIVFTMFLPSVGKEKDLFKSMSKGIIIGGAIMLMVSIRNIAVLGPGRLENVSYASAEAIRLIELAGFLERVESVVVIFWVVGVLIKALVVFYAAGLAASQIIKVKNINLFWLPIIALAFAANHFLTPSQFEVIKINYAVYPYFIVLQIIVPVFLLLVAKLRGLKTKEQSP